MVKELVSLYATGTLAQCHSVKQLKQSIRQFYLKTNMLIYNTHAFTGPFSGTIQVSRHQKSKTNLDFAEARDSEWQWHQLGCMQVCASLQTNNHASTSPLSFFTGRMPFLPPNQQCKSTEGPNMLEKNYKHLHLKAYHRKTTNHHIHNRHH